MLGRQHADRPADRQAGMVVMAAMVVLSVLLTSAEGLRSAQPLSMAPGLGPNPAHQPTQPSSPVLLLLAVPPNSPTRPPSLKVPAIGPPACSWVAWALAAGCWLLAAAGTWLLLAPGRPAPRCWHSTHSPLAKPPRRVLNWQKSTCLCFFPRRYNIPT